MDNLNVVITGGSRGLGFAIAKLWSKRGANVAICGRDERSLSLAEAQIGQPSQETVAFQCDVGNPDEVEHFLNCVAERFGHIDVLINDAGIITVGPLEEQRLEDFEEAMRTMYWGMVYTSLAVFPRMAERKVGHIVNITSIGGKVSAPHLLPYSCAKAAALAFSRGLQTESANLGIHVLTVVPGFMRSGSQEHAHFIGRPAPHPHAPDTPPGNAVLGPIAALINKIRDAMHGTA